MLGLLTLRDFDDHSYVHSVNVSILSVALGDYLGLNREQLFELDSRPCSMTSGKCSFRHPC